MEGEVLRRDVFPAEVLMPDGSLVSGVRVFVTSHRLIVYHIDAERRIGVLVDEELTIPNSVDGNMSTLQGRIECGIPDGTAWINLGRGCGCGSPLKAMGAPVSWYG